MKEEKVHSLTVRAQLLKEIMYIVSRDGVEHLLRRE